MPKKPVIAGVKLAFDMLLRCVTGATTTRALHGDSNCRIIHSRLHCSTPDLFDHRPEESIHLLARSFTSKSSQ